MSTQTPIHPFGYIENDKVYLKGFAGGADRQIGDVRNSPEESIAYFEEKFKIIEKKVEDITILIGDAQNKGSFLMKLLHLQKQIKTFDALGDFETLLIHTKELKKQLEQSITANHERNLEIKNALLVELEAEYDKDDWKEAGEAIKDIKGRWIKTGPVPPDNRDEMENRFSEMLQHFYKRRQDFFDEKNRLTEARIEQYQRLLLELKELGESQPNRHQAKDGTKAILAKWKEVGLIPRERIKPLWDTFDAIRTQILRDSGAGVPGERRPQKPYRPHSAPNRLALSQKSVELLQMPLDEALHQAKQLQFQWKNAKPIMGPKGANATRTFKYNCDLVFEKAGLQKMSLQRNPDFETLPESEQKRIKITILRDLIRKASHEIEVFETNMYRLSTDNNDEADKIMRGKLAAQKRKLQAKKDLLRKLNL